MQSVKNFFIIPLIFFLSCNGGEEEKPAVDPLVGEWIASPWYCNNEFECNVNPIDEDSYLTFRVDSVQRENTVVGIYLYVSNIQWHLPSGNYVTTITGALDDIILINEETEKIVIIFETSPPKDFQLIGDLHGDAYIGGLSRTYDDGGLKNFVWHQHVTVEKKSQ